MYSHPFPGNFNSHYPPPTKSIIDRIGLQMLKIPEFYCRVLDIMQSMNLPAPFFENSLDINSKGIMDSHQGMTNSDIELDNGDYGDQEISYPENDIGNEKINEKQKRNMSVTESRKRLKTLLDQFKNRTSTIPPRQGNGLSANRHISISIQTTPNASEIPTVCSLGQFGIFEPQQTQDRIERTRPQSPPFDLSMCLRISEIRRGVLKSDEKRRNPLFMDYKPGDISSRLYVKNISKKAKKIDLQRLFGAFVNSDTVGAFDICLLTKGRLHGQAFISFFNSEQSSKALRETNGYMLYGKPIVVVFARSAK